MTAVQPLLDGVPPSWATCWGDSGYGPWAGFMENNIVYAMYWIPPGRFIMGSPESEAGREDREQYKAYFETPHEVTLTRGFWMSEWPCTQDLWMAVMGKNPSHFKDPWRPVENVSWEDVQEFLQKLNARHTGLQARLPSEAEWEYACRAGKPTATYAGDLEILGDRIVLRFWTRLPGTAETADWSTSLPKVMTRLVGRRSSTATARRGLGKWGRGGRIHGGFATCWATYPSGARTGTNHTVARHSAIPAGPRWATTG